MNTLFSGNPMTFCRTRLLAGSALAGLTLFVAPVHAQQNNETKELSGKVLHDGSVYNLPVGENTEREMSAKKGKIPFAISVDGETVEAAAPADKSGRITVRPVAEDKSIDRQRKTDLGLQSVDIQIKYDGLESTPMLNVSTKPVRRSYKAGEQVRFLATANYPAFIERSEIRIYAQDDNWNALKPAAIIPVTVNSEAAWTMPSASLADLGGDYVYVLRVYDAKGRYDETQPLTLVRADKNFASDSEAPAVAPGMGEDRTALRNIPVKGGAVTVYGRNVPDGYGVSAWGETIPLDPDQAFVVQRILPTGDHRVDVAISGDVKDGGLQFRRDVNIPDNDWFYVGLADFTVGKNSGDKDIESVRPGEYDDVYNKGRLAFYLKGKIKGEYLLTAAADSTEDDVSNMFRNLDGKDSRALLRRLDPDDYYPVYGDDSTMTEDAPTRGKFYVRLERGDSHVMWGNYKTNITGTEFMRADRGLYGAKAEYRSEETTSFGERRTKIDLYAAQPDTLPQRDEFLATGGSAYFLKRQDIIEGSETITVEIRDAVTGRVIERQTLSYSEDYTIDYMQGVVLLKRPLSWTTGTDAPVREGALGGNKVYLYAQYEYEPLAGDVDGYNYGGRAQHWVNDKLRLGVTGMDESTGLAKQQAVGADIQLRHSETTFVEAEIAHSKGPGFGYARSTDGGLTMNDTAIAGNRDRAALAWRMRGQVDIEDLSDSGVKGIVGGYFEEKQAGFSSLYDQVTATRQLWGAHATVALNDKTDLKLGYDDFSDADGQKKREGTSSISWQVDEYWKASFGLTYTDLMSPTARASHKDGYNGSRLDAGVRLDYRWNDDLLLYGFGQGTVERSGDIRRNNRIGFGTEFKLTDTVGATAEASYGTLGWGGLAALNYNPTADDHYYIGYKLDPNRAYDLDRSYELMGSDNGAVVGGIRRKVDDSLSAFTESSYDMFGRRRSLTQTYGVIYTPDNVWTIDGSFEAGHINDDMVYTSGSNAGLEASDFERYAPALSIGYKDEEAGISARLRGEVRIDKSDDGSRNQNTYMLAGGTSWQTDPDWRLMTHVETVFSNSASTTTSFADTRYAEASVGYAYRPVENDRFNALFKYTWLYDLPGNNQLLSGFDGDVFAPAQRSHILSVDTAYDLFPWLTVGGKYGFRYGEVKYRIDDEALFADQWESSTAHLGVIRADLHIIKQWDLLLEGRVMHMTEAKTTDFGALAAVYRHIGDNFKLGVGYNFGQFSDDMRDMTFNDRGLFLNVIGKF